MSGGTFNVARSIWTHPAFADEPFTEREAFMWMVGEASYRRRERRAGNYVVHTDRGQLVASVRFLADAWQWSKSRVARFLKRLENRDTLRTESGTGILVITICDYEDYQNGGEDGGTDAGQSAGQMRDSSGTNEKKYKKDKKDSSLRSESSRASRLPKDWVLTRELGQWAVDQGMDPPQVRREAEKFRDYWHGVPSAKGRKADWPATWRNWIRKAMESAPRPPSPAKTGGSKDDRLARIMERSAQQDGSTRRRETNSDMAGPASGDAAVDLFPTRGNGHDFRGSGGSVEGRADGSTQTGRGNGDQGSDMFGRSSPAGSGGNTIEGEVLHLLPTAATSER